MIDRNTHNEPICEYSDLPIVMCAHCSGNTAAPEPLGLRALPAQPGRPVNLGEYQGLGYRRPALVPMPDHGRTCDCGRPAGDAFVCPACIDLLEVHLGNVPALIEDLEIAAQRRDRVRAPRRLPHLEPDTNRIFDGWPGFREDVDPDTPVTAQLVAADAARRWIAVLGRTRPDKAAAGNAADALKAELVSAAKALLDPIGQAWVGEDTPQAISLWLLTHSASVALSPAGPGICAGMQRVHRRCVSIVDSAPEIIHYGNCGVCGASLDVPDGASAIQCAGCGTLHTIEQLEQFRRDLAAGQLGTWGELEEWAAMLGTPIPKRRIEFWARSGRMQPRGSCDAGTLYRLGDALDLEAARRGRSSA